MQNLIECIARDLEDWSPGLAPSAKEALIERIAGQISGRAGWAEQRLKDGGSLSWLYDAKSSQLLVTYPNGANRIRLVAPPRG
ncbi:MAG: hypothetical protein ACOY94_15265 [Bacillota bacterium]